MKGLVAGVAVCLALAPFAAVAAASPSPDAESLRALLVGAPDLAWVELTPGDTSVLEGPFTADYYAKTEYDSASAQDSVIRRLNFDGFVAGYGRTFERNHHQDWIVDDVKAFGDSAGALSYWAWMRDFLGTSIGVSPIDSSTIPQSFGYNYAYKGFHATEIIFPKAVDVFTIRLGSYTDFMLADGLAQAQRQYKLATTVVAPSPTSSALPRLTASDTAAYDIGRLAGTLIVVALGVGVILLVIGLVVRARRRPAIPWTGAPLAVQMSPDRKYWWDGMAWQDAVAVAPAHAQRSPDGAYWWDGVSWRPVPAMPVGVPR